MVNLHLKTLILALIVFVMAAGSAGAFYFRGYTYNETGVILNNTNVSIEVYQMMGGPPTLVGTAYNSSNSSGFFNVSVTGGLENDQYFYKIRLRHFSNNATSGTLDYIGSSLPEFPLQMVSMLTMSPASPMNFYLKRGGTINLRAVNETSSVAFKYMIKDTRLGYPVMENFNVEQLNVNNLYVPLERNYSIMIFPNMSLPVSYDLTNLSNYDNGNATITFNTSIRPRWVSGYATLNGAAGFSNLSIIAYLMEPGNMIGKDRPMPCNMSAFRAPSEPNRSDVYNPSTGFFNITLPGSAQGAGANILLFAVANQSGTYYGAFRNITMNYSESNENNFNLTLQQLLGTAESIQVNDVGIFGPQNTRNITTAQLQFQLKNGTSNSNITNSFAHVEVEVNYSGVGTSFKWMVEVQQTTNGSFSIPALNANIRKINVFTQDFAPLKTSKTASQLANPPVPINLTRFEMKDPDNMEGNFTDVFMDMLMSKPECDRPYPAAGCSLTPAPNTEGNMSFAEFDPFKIVMGGGKISLRISKPSQRITVHYKNVDMLASGPPDALFDESASSSQSGSTIEEAWKFGSKGPEIYDEVIIGVPLTTTSISGVKIGKLYDENWNSVWNTTDTNAVSNIPSDYSTFPSLWFTTGPACSTTDNSSACYINTTDGMLWLRIPHFSGIGPTILRSTSTTGISGGSGSTGGGGVVSSESYSNIAKAERYDKNMIANTPVIYPFKAPELGIFEIVVTGKETENDIAIRVEALKGLSKSVSTAPQGVVYKHLNIIAGTAKIKEAVIKFKVENSWLADKNLAGSEVKLLRWDGSNWNQLETSEKNKDDKFTFYEAKTGGFSSFAIVGLKAAATTAASPVTAATPVATAAETPAAPTTVPEKKGVPGFEAITAFIAIALLAASLIKDRRR